MIEGLRRGLLVMTGLLVAGVTAMAVLIIALIMESSMFPAGTLRDILATVDLQAAMSGGDVAPLLRAGLGFLWAAVLSLCFAPVMVSVLLGEIVRARSFVWYAGVSGLCAASVPTLARAFEAAAPARSAQASAFEGRLTLIFFLTGVVGGVSYWLIAGRRSGAAVPVQHGAGALPRSEY